MRGEQFVGDEFLDLFGFLAPNAMTLLCFEFGDALLGELVDDGGGEQFLLYA